MRFSSLRAPSPLGRVPSSLSRHRSLCLARAAPVPAHPYIPASQRAAIRHRPVTQVLVVGHYFLPTGGNHWCFYLVHGGYSVHIDPTPTGPTGTCIRGGIKMNLAVSLLKYIVSRQAQHITTIQAVVGATVADFIDAIEAAGRDRYEFDKDGQGCRRWTSDQIPLFLEMGLLANAADAAQASHAVLFDYIGHEAT